MLFSDSKSYRNTFHSDVRCHLTWIEKPRYRFDVYPFKYRPVDECRAQTLGEFQPIKPVWEDLEVKAERAGVLTGEAGLDALESRVGVRVGGGGEDVGEGVGEDEVGVSAGVGVPFKAAGGGQAAVGGGAEELSLFTGGG